MMSKITQKKNLIVALIFAVFSNINVFSQHILPIDSLGTIWIITVDKSGSMLDTEIGKNSQKLSEYVKSKIIDSQYFHKINFDKDRFLFFSSGHLHKTNNVHVIKSRGDFDSSFIHITDYGGVQIHQFSNTMEIIEKISQQIAKSDYEYQLSFVSQIRVFSLVKAIKYLKREQLTKSFQNCMIVTITDDADKNDQWRNDYRTLKDYAPEELNKINITYSKYIYNPITGEGFGTLKDSFGIESKKNVPHIWGYSYTTKQSLFEKAERKKYFNITALDGHTIQLTPIIYNYRKDKILFFYIDSVIVNNNIHIINERFDCSRNLDLNYEKDFSKNKIQVFGSFQVQYDDSIWGEHYKKYYFSQSEDLPTAYRNVTILRVEISLLLLFFIFLIYWFIILPNKKLFVIYSNQGKKYVIKRGYKNQWTKNTIPVLSCVLNENNLSVICKKHQNIKTHDFNEILDTKNCFLICSNQKLFSEETVKENKISFNRTKDENGKAIDIEEFYNARSREYPVLLKHIFHRTLIFKVQNSFCNSSKPFVRKIGEIIVSTCNLFSPQYYYAIPIKTNNDISFRHSTLHHSKFIIEYSRTKINSITDINQRFNICCLNSYYESTSNKRFDALICYGTSENTIFWNVLIPEYEKDNSVSLKSAYNTYHYKQTQTKDTENQIPKNLILLRKEVKKQLRDCNKLKVFKIDVHSQENTHAFAITKVSCPGFLYLLEDTTEQKSLRLYSPFKDGLKEKKEVFVKKFKTENCHLYLSFLPPNLIKGDNTLMKRVSDELIRTSENYHTVLEIKNQKQVIFKNINTEI